MHWSKPLSLLAALGIAVAAAGSLAGLLTASLPARGAAVVVFGLVLVVVAGLILLGAGVARRRETPYW